MRQFSSANESALIGASLMKKKVTDDFMENLVGKFGKLTKHHYVAKKQAEFFKQLKENLQFGECVIVLDFGENYSFLVQDAVQGFH